MSRSVNGWLYEISAVEPAEWISGSDSEGRIWRDAVRASLARPGVEITVRRRPGLRALFEIMGTVETDPE